MNSATTHLFTLTSESCMPVVKRQIEMYQNNTDKKYSLQGYQESYTNPRKFNFQIPSDAAIQIIEMLNSIEISISPEEIWGIDGETYKLEIIRGMNVIYIEWWSVLPKEWKTLEIFAKKVLNVLDMHLSKTE